MTSNGNWQTPPYLAAAPFAQRPHGYQPAYVQPRWISAPATGWALIASGVLAIIGAVMPWATAFGGVISVSGIHTPAGVLALLVGLLMAASGVAIATRRGRRWIAITAIPVSAVATVYALLSALGTTLIRPNLDSQISIGAGYWITVIAMVACLAGAISACACRAN